MKSLAAIALLAMSGCALQPTDVNACFQHWDAGNNEERNVYEICQKFEPK